MWHSHFKKHRQFLLRVNIPSSHDPAMPHLDSPKRNAHSAHQSLAPGSSQQLCSQQPKPGDKLVLLDQLIGKQSVLQSTMEHYTATKENRTAQMDLSDLMLSKRSQVQNNIAYESSDTKSRNRQIQSTEIDFRIAVYLGGVLPGKKQEGDFWSPGMLSVWI